MLDNIIYSPSENACYDPKLNYPSSNPIPSDGVKVSTENWKEYWCSIAPDGKCCKWDPGSNCFCWVDLSPPTLEECKANKMASLKSQFDSEYSGGFHSDGVFYSSDDANRYRITKAKANSGGLVMNSGDMVMLNEAKSVQVDFDLNANQDSLDAKFYDAQNKVIAATTNDEVNAVVL